MAKGCDCSGDFLQGHVGNDGTVSSGELGICVVAERYTKVGHACIYVVCRPLFLKSQQ